MKNTIKLNLSTRFFLVFLPFLVGDISIPTLLLYLINKIPPSPETQLLKILIISIFGFYFFVIIGLFLGCFVLCCTTYKFIHTKYKENT